MAEERLQAKDLKVLLLWILAAIVAAGVAWKYFFVAFPEAAVDFRVSRPAALEQARKFLTARGDQLDRYQSTIIFQADDQAKNYLERELGLEKANQLMASQVNVWHWKARFFRAEQKEEFSVDVSPVGHIVGFEHVIEEARPGAHLDQAAARVLAKKFLIEQAELDLANYDFLAEEANPTERPNRRDWNFTWERHGFKAKDAPYRARVTVQGDRVGGLDEFLKVPEVWQRAFERMRSSNLFYQSAAQVPFAFLYGAVVLMLFDLGRRGVLRWFGALRLAFVLAVLWLVQAANEWPLTRASYDTNSSYAGFFFSQMTQAALSAVLLGLSVALTVAAAEPIYRRDFPEKLRLGTAFRLDGLRSKQFFTSCVIGLALAAVHIGYVVAFYIVGKRFGFWVPQEVKYTNAVSTALPWIYPLAIALYAATNEEFLFRLFAIPYLMRLTKSRTLAVVIPGFIWGFLHSAYQVEPGYARGLEVGLIGVVAGWVFLRWGIVATLVWHYTVDALLIGLFLLRSESLYFRLSGAVVAAFVLVPLGVAAAAWATRRQFASEEALVNRAVPVVASPVEPLVPPVAAGYESTAPSAWKISLIAGLVGVVLFIAVKPQAIGDFVRLALNAPQANRRADQILRQYHVDPSSYRHAVTFQGTFDGVTSEYLRRQVGIGRANRIYEHEVPSAFWVVRYFRDSQKEEYRVELQPDGSLHSVHHELDEKAPGTNLPKEEAQAKAEAYLRAEKKLDLAQWRLVETKSEKRPMRTDHIFVWEKLQAIGEAHVRQEVRILGDEVAGYRVFIKIPDEWRRQHTEQTLARSVYGIGRIVFFVAWGVTILVLFFTNLRQPAGRSVPWRRLAAWALWGALAVILLAGNNLQGLLMNYDTQMPLRTFIAILLMGLFLSLALLYSALYFLFGLAWFFLSRAFSEGRLPTWRDMPADYYRDAAWLGLAGACGLLGVRQLPAVLNRIWPTANYAFSAALPSSAASWSPALDAAAHAVLLALFIIGVLALVAGFFAAQVRQDGFRLALIVLLAVALVGRWGSAANFAERMLVELIFLSVWWGIVRAFRFNLLAYFLAIAATEIFSSAVELLRQPNSFYHFNGYALVAILVALFALPLVAWRSSVQLSAGGAET